MTVTPAEQSAMRRALALAARGPWPDPNPRVGCVLIDPDGQTVGEGAHLGAGTPHAEVAALHTAGAAARGATAVVTLEPCDHTGRTGPCSQALIDAGIRRVVYAQADPNPAATGGAGRLRAAGIDVVAGLLADKAAALNRIWSTAMRTGRPVVRWKFATTLDGRSAATDGTARWITSTAARADTHRLRAECDTILVGTGTVAADDPRLTVRDPDDRPVARQPLRAVMGLRDLAAGARVSDGAADTVLLRTRDPHRALADLFEHGRRHVFLEGGPTLAAAFLRAGLVDEVVAYVAPALLGAGPAAVGDLGIATIAGALRLPVTDVTVLPAATPDSDTNIRITMTGAAIQAPGEGAH